MEALAADSRLALFGVLPHCPNSTNVLTQALSYPSLFLTFAVAAVCSFVFVCVVGFKYNSVKVFEHRIRTPGISNTLWIVFFLFIFLRSTVEAVRFAVKGLDVKNDMWFMGVAFSLHACASLALSLTLNHQRTHRSSDAESEGEAASSAAEETDPLMRRVTELRRITLLEVVFVVLFVLEMVAAWLTIIEFHTNLLSDGSPYKWIFLGTFVAQRLPALALAIAIIAKPSKKVTSHSITGEPLSQDNDSATYGSDAGPSFKAKVFLAIATFLTAFGYLPLAVWAIFLPGDCFWWLGSGVDIVHLFYSVGLVFYFLFLRNEYLRCMESTIWNTVQKFQSSFSFDFRNF